MFNVELSRSSGDVEWKSIRGRAPRGSVFTEHNDPGDDEGQVDEGPDPRGDHQFLDGFLLLVWTPNKCFFEEPDGVDGPEEGQEGAPEVKVLLAQIQLVRVTHFRAGQIHGQRLMGQVDSFKESSFFFFLVYWSNECEIFFLCSNPCDQLQKEFSLCSMTWLARDSAGVTKDEIPALWLIRRRDFGNVESSWKWV